MVSISKKERDMRGSADIYTAPSPLIIFIKLIDSSHLESEHTPHSSIVDPSKTLFCCSTRIMRDDFLIKGIRNRVILFYFEKIELYKDKEIECFWPKGCYTCSNPTD